MPVVRIVPITASVLPHRQKDLIHYLLSYRLIADHSQQEAIDANVVANVQFLQRKPVASRDSH
jgi:hypothetical protein